MTSSKPPVGVSSCLLGEAVRYDGGHKREPVLVERLAEIVAWVPVCPEVELGLGTPREPMRLEREERNLKLVATESRRDLTAGMDAWAKARMEELEGLGLCGFVLKSRSPSCGLAGVPLHDPDGEVVGHTRGRFARALALLAPDLPVADEEDLRDEARLEAFLADVLRLAARRALGASSC